MKKLLFIPFLSCCIQAKSPGHKDLREVDSPTYHQENSCSDVFKDITKIAKQTRRQIESSVSERLLKRLDLSNISSVEDSSDEDSSKMPSPSMDNFYSPIIPNVLYTPRIQAEVKRLKYQKSRCKRTKNTSDMLMKKVPEDITKKFKNYVYNVPPSSPQKKKKIKNRVKVESPQKRESLLKKVTKNTIPPEKHIKKLQDTLQENHIISNHVEHELNTMKKELKDHKSIQKEYLQNQIDSLKKEMEGCVVILENQTNTLKKEISTEKELNQKEIDILHIQVQNYDRALQNQINGLKKEVKNHVSNLQNQLHMLRQEANTKEVLNDKEIKKVEVQIERYEQTLQNQINALKQEFQHHKSTIENRIVHMQQPLPSSPPTPHKVIPHVLVLLAGGILSIVTIIFVQKNSFKKDSNLKKEEESIT